MISQYANPRMFGHKYADSQSFSENLQPVRLCQKHTIKASIKRCSSKLVLTQQAELGPYYCCSVNDHSFSTHAKFSKKLIIPIRRYVHVRLRIKG